MSDGHNFAELKAHILPLSVASDFDVARKEWQLIGVEITEDFDNCPCGKQIKEHCYIRNLHNGNTTYVGNVCINKFVGIDTGNLFDGLKRIAKDSTANANYDVIEFAWKAGYLFDEKEYRFLRDTMLKRNLSMKQIAWKQKINRRILSRTVVKKRGAHE